MSAEVAGLDALSIVERDGGVTFEVRVLPRASQAAFVGLHRADAKVVHVADTTSAFVRAALERALVAT